MIRLQVKRKGADEALRNLAKNVQAEMVDELRRFGATWERNVKLNFGPGGKSARGGPKVRNRTGALRRSVNFRLVPAQLAVVLSVGDKSTPYAGIQEHGGKVRAKGDGYLTVPLTAALSGSGAVAGSARIRPAGLRRTRSGKIRKVFKTDKGETFIFKSKTGKLFVALKPKSGAKFDPDKDLLYILKKEVDVPARLGAWDAARFDGPNGAKTIRGFEQAAARGVKK
jgi:hypothetical protein